MTNGYWKGLLTDIVDAAKRTGVRIAGPIPLPTKRKIITVIRSPHIDRRSQEQFEMRTFTFLLDIIQPTAETVDRLRTLPIAAGVGNQDQSFLT